MGDNPCTPFDAWFAEAQASDPNDPYAVALATLDDAGNQSARMMLLKGMGPRAPHMAVFAGPSTGSERWGPASRYSRVCVIE